MNCAKSRVNNFAILHKLHTHLLIAQVQELVKLNPTVGERTERPLLLELGGEGGVGNLGIGLRNSHKNGPSAFRPLSSPRDTARGHSFDAPSCVVGGSVRRAVSLACSG